MKSFLIASALIASVAAQSDAVYGGINPSLSNPAWYPDTSYLHGTYKHVIVLSVDGLHNVDLAKYVKQHPKSNLATASKHGITFSNALTSQPSDSFPGTLGIYTGAVPATHGIWYDATYDKSLYPPGSGCKGNPGTEVLWDETIDADDTMLNGGKTFNYSALPQFKTSWGDCTYLLPSDYVRVNTVFEVVRQNGGSTKYTDKHPSYEYLNGPSGTGIYELYTPEIASTDGTVNGTMNYDDLHWNALYDWTLGKHQNGKKDPKGIPALYGSNFQTVSVAQKSFGYKDAQADPTATVESAFNYIDARFGKLVATLKKAGIYQDTLIFFGAKHGQAPIDPKTLKKIDPSKLTAAAGVPLAHATTDDIGLLVLKNQADAPKAKANLLKQAKSLNIKKVLIQNEIIQNGYGNNRLDPRVPDVIVIPEQGTIYASPTASKVEEHGGFNPDDVDVALLVTSPRLHSHVEKRKVFNRQIAPTILKALGLPVYQLEATIKDGTPVLPGF